MVVGLAFKSSSLWGDTEKGMLTLGKLKLVVLLGTGPRRDLAPIAQQKWPGRRYGYVKAIGRRGVVVGPGYIWLRAQLLIRHLDQEPQRQIDTLQPRFKRGKLVKIGLVGKSIVSRLGAVVWEYDWDPLRKLVSPHVENRKE